MQPTMKYRHYRFHANPYPAVSMVPTRFDQARRLYKSYRPRFMYETRLPRFPGADRASQPTPRYQRRENRYLP